MKRSRSEQDLSTADEEVSPKNEFVGAQGMPRSLEQHEAGSQLMQDKNIRLPPSSTALDDPSQIIQPQSVSAAQGQGLDGNTPQCK